MVRKSASIELKSYGTYSMSMEEGLGEKVLETFARGSITSWLKKKTENYQFFVPHF